MTAKIPFTKTAIRQLSPQKTPYWFEGHPGMGLEVLATKRQFIVYAVTRERKPIRYKFGRFDSIADLDLERVKETGKAALWLIKRKGINPKTIQGQLARAVALYQSELDAAEHAMTLFAGGASAVKAVEAAFEHTERHGATMTLQELFDEYLTTGPGRKNKRKNEYHDLFRRNIPKEWMARTLGALRPDEVATQYGNVSARAEIQASLTFTKLNALYNYALKNGYILESEHAVRPLRNKLDGFPSSPPRDIYLTDADIPKWYSYVSELADGFLEGKDRRLKGAIGVYALLVLYTAMRDTEARCLCWLPEKGQQLPEECSGTVDLENRSFRLFAEHSKNNKTEIFPLSRQPYALLVRLRERRGQSPWLFPGRMGKYMSSAHVRRTMAEIAEASEISDPRVRSHDVRRTTTTVASHVIPGHALDRLTRHATKGITAKHYVIHDLEKLRRPTQKIADEIDRLANLDPPIEIALPRKKLPELLGALRGHEVLSLILENLPEGTETALAQVTGPAV